MNMNLTSGPSSWDRDMQGMQGLDEAESDNLAALGMHVTDDKKKDDEDEEEDDEDLKIKDDAALADASASDDDEDEEEDKKEKEEEEVDALKELDMLAEKLKQEDAPTMTDDEE